MEPLAIGVLLNADKDDRFSRRSRFGMTFTFDGRPWRGVVDVVSGGFPCRTSAQRRRGAGLVEEADSGAMARSFAKYGPATRSWEKNSQCSLFAGLGTVLETWPRWGSMRMGVLGAHSIGANHKR